VSQTFGAFAKANTTTSEQDLVLVVSDVELVCDRVVTLTLQQPDGSPLPQWAPGAHIDLNLGAGLVRQYSLCGPVDDRFNWRLAILREESSRGGSERVHQLRVGQTVRVCGPRNRFPLIDSRRYLFVAGGIGITPILPMAEVADHAGADWTLLYGGRNRASMPFLGELSRYGGRVSVRPQDQYGLLDIEGLLRDPYPDTRVYCCGPEPLLAAVEAACDQRPEVSLHIERFAAQISPSVIAQDTTFEVEFRSSDVTVEVSPGMSILEAAEAAGIRLESSCHEGVCGTCETLVLEGQPDHRDSVLGASERESGEVMMICCSRARTPRLVLDL
jgi:ferredoxin-NADP reductase